MEGVREEVEKMSESQLTEGFEWHIREFTRQ
jgi:hypothetical protein